MTLSMIGKRATLKMRMSNLFNMLSKENYLITLFQTQVIENPNKY